MHIKHPDYVTSARDRALLERFCDRLLIGIERRGQDAAGFVAQTFDGATILDKKNTTASDFIKTRKRLPEGTRSILLHTRLATQGPPEVWGNNHPVFFGTTFTVHNGTIRNDDALFKKYGLERAAQVDSEIIPAVLDKFGLDNAAKAFEELSGGFATASFDPIRFPGMVVLAANGTWPIVVHENKHFLVWASTYEAIESAWSAVLGTPPRMAKCEGFQAGDMMILNGADVERKPNGFKPYTYQSTWKGKQASTGYSGGSHYNEKDWWEYMDDDEGEPYWGARSDSSQYASCAVKPSEILDNETVVKQLRANGEGNAIPYKDKGVPRNAAFLETYGNDKWKYCVHCKDTIADVQVMKGTKFWGDICVDCYAIAKQAYNEKMNLGEYLGNLDISEQTFRTIQSFADIQTYIHSQALFRVAAATGIKRTTVDFLIHRADLSYLENDDNVTDLYADLSDRYFDAVAEVWQAYVQETRADDKTEERTTWVTCAAGTHKKGEKCDACSTDGNGSTVTTDPALDKCAVCGRKPKTILGKSGAWCKKHWGTCAGSGKQPYTEKCKGDTIGFTEDGHRWCHVHSRGRKGFIGDKDSAARKRLAEKRERVRAY